MHANKIKLTGQQWSGNRPKNKHYKTKDQCKNADEQLHCMDYLHVNETIICIDQQTNSLVSFKSFIFM